MRWLLVVGLALGLAGLGAWQLDAVSGQSTVTKVVSPSSCALGGGSFEVRIDIEEATNLGSYEWQLTYNPAVVLLEGRSEDGSTVPAWSTDCSDGQDNDGDTKIDSNDPDCFLGVVNGGFLGSTGRTVFCPDAIVDEGSVRFGCITTGTQPPAPTGSGVLSMLTFSPVAGGVSPLELDWVSLSDPLAEDLPSARVGGCVAIGSGASCVAPTTAPPATATAAATVTPGGEPTETPILPGPTNTPVPTGPAPTPTPLPPGFEAVDLVAGCNPVASTYPDNTPIQTLSDAVGPAGNLVALWKFEAGIWRAFSPQYPQASDLTEADLLDVVFACVSGPGAFVRPVI